MVDSGHTQIRPIGFEDADGVGLPVEVVTRSALFERVGLEWFSRPDRPSFDVLILVHEGGGFHGVDFEHIPLVPGRVVRVRPGQVQSWDIRSAVDATLVLSSATPRVSTPHVQPQASCDLGRDSLATATALIDALRTEQRRFDGADGSVRLMTTLFEALDAVFERALASSSTSQLPDPYLQFRSAIDEGIGTSRNVRDFARTIGYSERTISRACQRATGLSAKGVLDQRLVLEAQRLLAHTDQPASAIARQLGFTEATNFAKFFQRNTGLRPTEFRATTRPSS